MFVDVAVGQHAIRRKLFFIYLFFFLQCYVILVSVNYIFDLFQDYRPTCVTDTCYVFFYYVLCNVCCFKSIIYVVEFPFFIYFFLFDTIYFYCMIICFFGCICVITSRKKNQLYYFD